MRLIYVLLGFLLIHSTACSKPERRDDRDVSVREWVSSIKEQILVWSEKCQEGVSKKSCADGDSTLWNGLVCASGDAFACQAVVRSQTPDGRVWRSPRLAGNDPEHTFSRDMGLGTLAFIARTKDEAFGERWASYINDNGGLCEKNNSDCSVRPPFYWVFNDVADSVGFKKLSASVLISKTGKTDGIVDESTLLAQANTAAKGFELHLIGVHLYIRILIGSWSDTLQRTADTLHRREPNNLFFEFISKGRSDQLARKFIAVAPKAENAHKSQWCWERTDSENACADSMGWDFVFMANLLSL